MSGILIVGFLFVLRTNLYNTLGGGETRNDFEDFLRNHPYNQRVKLTPAEWKKRLPKKDRPDLAAEQDFFMTLDPALKMVPRERLIQAFEKAEISRSLRTASVDWDEHGPDNVGGRTRAVMFDPNDSEGKKFWAGGVTGGLWFTDDITASEPLWNKIDDFWDNIAVSCIADDPVNPQIFYVGTGEIYSGASRGFGIWKTTNAGVTWTRLTSTENFLWVNDIVVRNESGVAVVYVAAGDKYYQGVWHNGTEGLLRSTNDGATFTPVWSGEHPNQPSDLEIDANNNIWAGTRNNSWGSGGGQILKSSDGTTWSTVYTTDDANRMELACAPSDANVVYAVGSGGSGDNDIGVFVKSTDGGTTWPPVTIPLNTSGKHFTRGQAWYDLILAVDPNDENTLYAGGIDLHKSIDSGNTWNQISHWYGGFELDYVHADQHSFAFRPGNPNTVVFGNDGGLHMTTDAGDHFTAKNSGYNVTQFYSCALHPNAGEYYFLAGSQDNGTQQFDSAGIDSTKEVTGGDGAFCFIDQMDPALQITSYIFNNYYLSSDGFQTYTSLSSEDDNTGRFINPADYDDNSNILYSASGEDSLKRTFGIDNADYIEINSNSVKASHIRVSQFTDNTIFIGTGAGRLFKVTDADDVPSISEITGDDFPTGYISCIELGDSENQILVTFSNYGVISVWETSDGGTIWTDKEGDLPDMPVRWALYNPDNRHEVILATEVGVWSTTDFNSASPVWTASNSGLANVRTDMLQIRDSDHFVIAATHGRGLFSTTGFSAQASVQEELLTPEKFILHQNYPNPFNPTTTIKYELFQSSQVTISVYDILGRFVKTLVNRTQDPGVKTIQWDATNEQGNRVSAGVYIYKLKAGNFIETKEMVLLK
jgi:hypothetical protein